MAKSQQSKKKRGKVKLIDSSDTYEVLKLAGPVFLKVLVNLLGHVQGVTVARMNEVGKLSHSEIRALAWIEKLSKKLLAILARGTEPLAQRIDLNLRGLGEVVQVGIVLTHQVHIGVDTAPDIVIRVVRHRDDSRGASSRADHGRIRLAGIAVRVGLDETRGWPAVLRAGRVRRKRSRRGLCRSRHGNHLLAWRR